MTKFRSRKVAASLLAASASSVLFAASAHAQATASTTPAQDETVALQKFVVTGSLLPQSEAVGSSPVVALTSEQFSLSGAPNPLEFFRRQTPYFFGNGNIGRETNNGGPVAESWIALRNLTTLVLVDGRRVVNSPVSNGALVDLNTIPTSMIERIEILKDGASTIYGSDAIGGVVNIITKKNFEGFELRARQGWDTASSDYKTEDYSVMGGFIQGKNRVTVLAQYYRSTHLKTTDRPLATLDFDELVARGRNGSPNYMSGSYPGRVGNFLLAGSPLAAGAAGYNAGIISPPAKASPGAAPMTIDQMVAAGYYVRTSTTPRFAKAGSAAILNTTLFGTDSINPLDRKQFFANFERDVAGENLQFFSSFMFNQSKSTGVVLAPGPTGIGIVDIVADDVRVPASNPYNWLGVDIGGPGGGQGVRSRFIDVGLRFLDVVTDTYRFVGGFRGKISEDYSWEIGANYNRAEYKSLQNNAVNGYAFTQANTPLLDTGGNYVRDTSGRILSVLTDSQGNVPVYNFFALPGVNDPRTVNAIKASLFQVGNTELKSADVVFRGTPISLPAGKLAFAVGAEYRGEELNNTVDTLFASQHLMGGLNSVDNFPGGKIWNKSVFAEVSVPIFAPEQRVPGAYSLGLDVSGRHEEINGGDKSNVPKIGLKWQPFNNEFTLRSTYAEGFVRPTIFDLFGPTQGNSPTVTLFSTESNENTTIQISSLELSNPNLKPSTSKTYTAGFVYSPKAVRGLNISVDYYHIEQDRVGSIDYQSILNNLNAAGAASPFASAYLDANGLPLTSNAANQVTLETVGSLTIAKNPQGDQKVEGVDLDISYDFDLPGELGHLRAGVLANYTLSFKFRPGVATPYHEYAGNFTTDTTGFGGSNGLLPDYNYKFNLQHTWNGLSTLVTVGYIPEVTDPGDTFGEANAVNSYTVSGKPYEIASYTTVDLSMAYDFGRKFSGPGWRSYLKGLVVQAGVNNLFDKGPPFVPSSDEDNTDKQSYDILGRFVYVEVKKTF